LSLAGCRPGFRARAWAAVLLARLATPLLPPHVGRQLVSSPRLHPWDTSPRLRGEAGRGAKPAAG